MSKPSWQQTPPEAPPEPQRNRGCMSRDTAGCCLRELFDSILDFVRCSVIATFAVALVLAAWGALG